MRAAILLNSKRLKVHLSILPDALSPSSRRLFFLRAPAYLQEAVFLVEEGTSKPGVIRKRISESGEGMANSVCFTSKTDRIAGSIGNPDRPLDDTDGLKPSIPGCACPRCVPGTNWRTAEEEYTRQRGLPCPLTGPETPPSPRSSGNDDEVTTDGDTLWDGRQWHMASYSAKRKTQRPGAPGTLPLAPRVYAAGLFTTYHPLRVESRFSVLFCLFILEDFAALLRAFVRAATVVDGLEDYPIVLPPRSMAQVEFFETLERLAGGLHIDVQPRAQRERQ